MTKKFRIVQTNSKGMELVEHGTALFPLDNVYDDFSIMDTVSWHWHYELEMGIILRGILQITIDTESYCLKEGDAFFINSETLHTIFDKEHIGCILRSIVFHPRLVGGSKDSIFFQGYVKPLLMNRDFKGMIFRTDDEQAAYQIKNIYKIISLCDDKTVGYELTVRSLLSDIILYLFTLQHDIQKTTTEVDRRNESRFREMLQLIESRYYENITLKEIADAAFISKTECIRCFKGITGRTPIQYLREYRIQKAAELLISTDMSVSSIGEQCGFLEMSYFSRCFRQQYEATPSEYRKKLTAMIKTGKNEKTMISRGRWDTAEELL